MELRNGESVAARNFEAITRDRPPFCRETSMHTNSERNLPGQVDTILPGTLDDWLTDWLRMLSPCSAYIGTVPPCAFPTRDRGKSVGNKYLVNDHASTVPVTVWPSKMTENSGLSVLAHVVCLHDSASCLHKSGLHRNLKCNLRNAMRTLLSMKINRKCYIMFLCKKIILWVVNNNQVISDHFN